MEKASEDKTESPKLKVLTVEDLKQKYCVHCPNNPKAAKPFIEMKQISIDEDVYEKIVAKDKNPTCMLCWYAHQLAIEIDKFPKDKK